MHAAAVVVLMAASASAECRRDDCGHCCVPRRPMVQEWREFWCNIALPLDIRQKRDWWPLEYPGERARGWQAHGSAATRTTPINYGPNAAIVTLDENGLPHVKRPPEPTPIPLASPFSSSGELPIDADPPTPEADPSELPPQEGRLRQVDPKPGFFKSARRMFQRQ